MNTKGITKAKSSPVAPKVIKRPAAQVVETIEDDEEITEVEENEVEGDEVDPATDLVRVSVNTTIDPAPRVGGIDMVRDFGVSKLTPGVHSLPRVVAAVLVDRKLGELV